MHATDFISTKRDKKEHTPEEIALWFQMIQEKEIQDDQIAAWLMAVYLHGLSEKELYAVTSAMIDSGDRIDLSGIEGIVVDKHSTGGVADTTTLVTGPIVASLGIPFAKMSGRGLGHTGGTLDKLAAIPGLRTDLTEEEFVGQVNAIRIAITGQTGELVPADGKLYSLRDVTATVSSIPLIASSIMSKKLAVGADKIVLDVKVGSGAFMPDTESAIELAQTMTKIGAHFGKETIALITDMDEPLGDYIGNALEVYEAVQILDGKCAGRLKEVSIALVAEEIMITDPTIDPEQADMLASAQIENKEALNTFIQMVEEQGGDTAYIREPEKLFQHKFAIEVTAEQSGTIQRIDARGIGEAALELGCGRLKKTDILDLYAGIHLKKRSGEAVDSGDVIATIYANDEEKAKRSKTLVLDSFRIGERAESQPLILAKVTATQVDRFEV